MKGLFQRITCESAVCRPHGQIKKQLPEVPDRKVFKITNIMEVYNSHDLVKEILLGISNVARAMLFSITESRIESEGQLNSKVNRNSEAQR